MRPLEPASIRARQNLWHAARGSPRAEETHGRFGGAEQPANAEDVGGLRDESSADKVQEHVVELEASSEGKVRAEAFAKARGRPVVNRRRSDTAVLVVDDDGPYPPSALENDDGEDERVAGARLEVPASRIEQETKEVAGDDANDGREEGAQSARAHREVQGEESAVERFREDGLRDQGDNEKELSEHWRSQRAADRKKPLGAKTHSWAEEELCRFAQLDQDRRVDEEPNGDTVGALDAFGRRKEERHERTRCLDCDEDEVDLRIDFTGRRAIGRKREVNRAAEDLIEFWRRKSVRGR